MDEDALINLNFKDCLFVVSVDYPYNHKQFCCNQFDWARLHLFKMARFWTVLKSLSQAAANRFICVLFLRSLPSERFQFVCLFYYS